MAGLIITKKLLDDVEAIARYFDKDSAAILQNLVAQELERIAPLIKALEETKKQSETGRVSEILHSGDLEKSKPVEGEFAGVKIWERNWRGITLQILKILRDKNYVTGDELTTLLPAIANINIVPGIRDDSGYIPMQELGVSVQGLSAPRVGDFIQKIAEYFEIQFRFKVRWSNADSPEEKERTGIFASTEA